MSTVEPAWRRFTVPNALTPEYCGRLLSSDRGYRPFVTQGDDGAHVHSDQRSSTGAELAHGPENDWVINAIHPHVLRLNQYFRFEIAGYSAVQILRYEPGQQYAWHVDMGRDDIATRKLSIIVLLTDPADYTGGELEWMPDLGPCPKAQGTLIAFPSFMPHRVAPVLTGVRFALVTWVHGDRPFS